MRLPQYTQCPCTTRPYRPQTHRLPTYSRYSMRQMNKIFNHIKSYYNRHKRLCNIVGIIVIVYTTIRVFFTPPLLSGIDFSHAYYDRNGNLMRLTLSSDDKFRLFTPIDKISPDLIRATVLYEDKYFYTHPGINPISLIRATRNYVSGNHDTPGASG